MVILYTSVIDIHELLIARTQGHVQQIRNLGGPARDKVIQSVQKGGKNSHAPSHNMHMTEMNETFSAILKVFVCEDSTLTGASLANFLRIMSRGQGTAFRTSLTSLSLSPPQRLKTGCVVHGGAKTNKSSLMLSRGNYHRALRQRSNHCLLLTI